MAPAATTNIATNGSINTVARIDAQDEDFILPVREFLISFGCEVFVNQPLSEPSEYHIICGDADFVKQIISSRIDDSNKRLIIITDGDDKFLKNSSLSAKAVLVDFSILTAEHVFDVFHFFFTSEATLLDLRKSPKKHVQTSLSDSRKHMAHVKEKHEQTDAERINSIISSIFSVDKQAKPSHRKPKRFPLWLMTIFFILLPFFWYSVSLTMATATTLTGALFLRSGKNERAAQIMNLSRFWIHQSSQALGLVGQPIALIYEKPVYSQERYISLLYTLSQSISGASSIFTTGKSLAGALIALVAVGNQTASPAREVEKLRTELFSVQNNLGLAQSDIRALRTNSSFPFWIPAIKKLGERGEFALSGYRQTISSIDKFLLMYPRVAGFKHRQVYLVLLQNSLELRPTGGFMGSLAVISTEEGRVASAEVRDVYEVDGQLKGHVDPPLPIKELLGQEHWYLRDSNWDPDFRKSAARAAWFYEKETGVRADGVIGISTPLIIDLLSVIGPITLPDYNDRITSQNFYGKSLFYTQSDFFPGSTQKKDFLGSFARVLLDELTASKNLNPVTLFRVITNGLVRRDLLVYFSDQELGSLATQFGWAGAVFASSGCQGVSTSCLFDPFMLVEANLGVNKVNYFIQRELTQTISIAQNGSVTHTVALVLKNTSSGKPNDSGGVYRLYARYMLPVDSQISEVLFNGTVVSFADTLRKKPQSIPYAEYDTSTGILGVAVEVPPGESGQMTIEYVRKIPLQFQAGKATYEIFIQKQPGVVDAPVGIFVDYPPFWEVHTEQPFLAKEGRLEYNSILSQDRYLRFEFQK